VKVVLPEQRQDHDREVQERQISCHYGVLRSGPNARLQTHPCGVRHDTDMRARMTKAEDRDAGAGLWLVWLYWLLADLSTCCSNAAGNKYTQQEHGPR
jgi:hypothetical protein